MREQENIIKGIDKWWANGNIICNEHQRPRELHSQVRWASGFSLRALEPPLFGDIFFLVP